MKIIAHIYNDYTEKFGIPRQSGLVQDVCSVIVFEPEYRNPQALRGLEDFSHIWLLWEFSKAKLDNWLPTVLPPRLGGKTRMGVFATRSPFRPNPIGMSSVELVRIDMEDVRRPVLIVKGADMLNGTPIYDIKPYLSYTDSHPDAVCGFADRHKNDRLSVVFPQELLELLPSDKRNAILEILALDPRPSYQEDAQRRYGMAFAGYDIRFHVCGSVLTVVEVVDLG